MHREGFLFYHTHLILLNFDYLKLKMFYYIFIIILILAAAYFLSWRPRRADRYYNQQRLWFAHRGAMLKAPENTLSSFQKATDSGLPAVEMDVVSTKDGVVVCSHNFDLEEKTDGFGYIHQMNHDQLNDIRIFGPEESTEHFCTLAKALKEAGKNTRINIEIKTFKKFDLGTAIRVLRIIKNADISDRVMISSFYPIPLILIKLLNRTIPTGFIIQNKELLPLIHLIKPDSIHPRGDIISAEFIHQIKRKGMRLNAWTINTKPAIEWLENQGVDGIITDRLEFYNR